MAAIKVCARIHSFVETKKSTGSIKVFLEFISLHL